MSSYRSPSDQSVQDQLVAWFTVSSAKQMGHDDSAMEAVAALLQRLHFWRMELEGVGSPSRSTLKRAWTQLLYFAE